MTLRLDVDRLAWNAHVDTVARSYDRLIPVVKGNGYGLGRRHLADVVIDRSLAAHTVDGRPVVAVGTVHELAGLPSGLRPVVLTPLPPASRPSASITAAGVDPVLTVGTASQAAAAAALEGWSGSVVVKLASSMQRFGASADEIDDVVGALGRHGIDVAGWALHLPLAGDEMSRRAEIDTWLARLAARTDPVGGHELWLSHVSPELLRDLGGRWPDWSFPVRVGSRLWHGDKSMLHLSADVIDVRAVRAGDVAGYRHASVPGDGILVMVGCGTAHGVTALDGGPSPFHFRRQRVALLERPHMHTSMLFVPAGAPTPAVGDNVDVQRPLITVMPDDVIWR